MNFIELAKDRFSVREFSPRPVGDEKITKILQAAKVAPTAVNYQPQKLYVIKSPAAILPLGYPSEGCLPSNRHAAYRADEEMIRYR